MAIPCDLSWLRSPSWFTSLKTQGQISIVGAPIWPAETSLLDYNGKKVEVFNVPMAQCAGFDPNTQHQEPCHCQKGTPGKHVCRPRRSGRGEFTCAVSWRALDRPWQFSPTWEQL
jgi:hypothetical protein